MNADDHQVHDLDADVRPAQDNGDREELDSWSNPYPIRDGAPWLGRDPAGFAAQVIRAERCHTGHPRTVPGTQAIPTSASGMAQAWRSPRTCVPSPTPRPARSTSGRPLRTLASWTVRSTTPAA